LLALLSIYGMPQQDQSFEFACLHGQHAIFKMRSLEAEVYVKRSSTVSLDGKTRCRMKFRYWVPVVLWVGFLFVMSTDLFSSQATFPIIERIVRFLDPSISARQIDLLNTIIRKLAHVTEYFIFGILLFRAFRGGSAEPQALRWAFSSFVVLALLAASDEFHQSFSAERTASIVDVTIDSFGGFLAQCVSVFWFHWHRR
jgi:VanZ family protein